MTRREQLAAKPARGRGRGRGRGGRGGQGWAHQDQPQDLTEQEIWNEYEKFIAGDGDMEEEAEGDAEAEAWAPPAKLRKGRLLRTQSRRSPRSSRSHQLCQ